MTDDTTARDQDRTERTAVKVGTIRSHPTGVVRVEWRDGRRQSAEVRVDGDTFRFRWEHRWGPQFTDRSVRDLPPLTRAGAEALRDALTAALEWHALPETDR